MKKETLQKAREIEEDIKSIEKAVNIHKDTRHFEFVEHYGSDATRVKMPRWMNDKLLAVLADERERLEHELEVLSDDTPMEQGDWKPMRGYAEGDHVVFSGVEYEYRDGRFVPVNVPVRKRSWLERWYNMLPFAIIILDVTGLGWFVIKYWSTFYQYFDMIFALNMVVVLALIIFVMAGIETYIESKNKR